VIYRCQVNIWGFLTVIGHNETFYELVFFYFVRFCNETVAGWCTEGKLEFIEGSGCSGSTTSHFLTLIHSLTSFPRHTQGFLSQKVGLFEWLRLTDGRWRTDTFPQLMGAVRAILPGSGDVRVDEYWSWRGRCSRNIRVIDRLQSVRGNGATSRASSGLQGSRLLCGRICIVHSLNWDSFIRENLFPDQIFSKQWP